MTPSIASIPTMYAGTRYRSRLEARWAATWDLLGWVYDYEPQDLGSPGAGYIADFVAWPAGRAGRPVLVECKPEDTAAGLARARERVLDRAAGWLLSDLPASITRRRVLEARRRALEDDETAAAMFAREFRSGAGTLRPDVADAWVLATIDVTLAALDALPDLTDDEIAAEAAHTPRTAIVVGPQVFASGFWDAPSPDDRHVLCICSNHVGIINVHADRAHDHCVACGGLSLDTIPHVWTQELFREAGNVVQWRPPEVPGHPWRGAGPLRPAPRSCSWCRAAFPTSSHFASCGARR